MCAVRGEAMRKLFIVGCPRSGTTMVQQALNRHSSITIPPETKFFFSYLGQSRRQQLRHLQRLRSDLGIPLDDPGKRIRSAEDARRAYDEMARLYLERLGKSHARYFGDKTPEHTGQLGRILSLFPDSKIIFVYRDGRDVALSLTRVPWMSGNLYVNFLVWLYYYRVLTRARGGGVPNVYFARYEDIVAAPANEFRRILDFLELPDEAAVAEGYGNREGIPVREYGWKWRALERITADRVGVFRRELDPTQIAILERLGKNALAALAYPLVTSGSAPLSFTFLMKTGWSLSRLVLQLPGPALMRELFSASLNSPGGSIAVDAPGRAVAPVPLPAPTEVAHRVQSGPVLCSNMSAR